MGFVKGLLSGGAGSGFSPVGATPAQMKTSWENTQNSIKQQQDFVNALQGQNGLAHQSDVFNQQQGLANQFQNVANGQGPNPAMAALNQATGQNVSNQAALMAGQRGAGANAGLIARQAAMQGGNLQQQAVGQGATMQAQQQLAALGQLQQQQANMGSMANAQVGQQQTGLQNLGQQSSQQQSNIYGLQQNANNINGQLAGQRMGAQSALLGNLMGAAGTGIGMLTGGPMGAMIGGQMGKSMAGGGDNIPGGSGGSPDMMMAAEGGQIKGPKSFVAKHFHGIKMAEGGKVPALVSPGEVYLKPQDVKQVASGQKAPMDGEKIPGKPKVAGAKNSYTNDTVSKTLDEGGIVLPRSVTQSKDPEKKAAEFIRAVLSKNKLKK